MFANLKDTPDQEIISAVGMAELPLIISYLNEKYKGRVQLIDIGENCMIRYGETNVANISYLPVILHFMKIENGMLHLEGNVSWPQCLKSVMSLKIMVNDEKYDVPTYDYGWSKKRGKVVYECCDYFSFSLPVSGMEKVSISFIYTCKGIESRCGKINSMRFMPVSDILPEQYAFAEGYLMKIREASLILEKKKERDGFSEEVFLNAAKDRLGAAELEKIRRVRERVFSEREKKEKPLILFMDRLNKADDNGQAIFEYACRKYADRLDCRFVIDENCPDYAVLSKSGTVVKALSEEHWALLPQADFILTSQLNGWVENPYGEFEEYFRDIYHHAKVVFLQHGVTKDDQTLWLNRFNQDLFALVTSADVEAESFRKLPYHYEASQIWNVGMPRFDKLYHNEKKQILFMPTWRKEVMEQKIDPADNTYKWYLKDQFYHSSYYNNYHSILSDEAFLEKCRLNGYEVVFMPHPLMQPYVSEFKVTGSVKILPYETNWRDLFAESDIMITDYSSVAFDFAYLKKPILYFQFDEKDFWKGHTYSKGYFNYRKMGFGRVIKNRRFLMNAILSLSREQGKSEEKFRKRIERFFSYIDTGCCERIMQRVIEEVVK